MVVVAPAVVFAPLECGVLAAVVEGLEGLEGLEVVGAVVGAVVVLVVVVSPPPPSRGGGFAVVVVVNPVGTGVVVWPLLWSVGL